MGDAVMRECGTRRRRKGFIFIEIVLGILILTGVMVAMSRFFAQALLATLKAQDISNEALSAYSQACWIAFEPNLTQEKLNALPDDVRVTRDAGVNDLKLELKVGGDTKAEINLAAYRVGGDKHPLRVYRDGG